MNAITFYSLEIFYCQMYDIMWKVPLLIFKLNFWNDIESKRESI